MNKNKTITLLVALLLIEAIVFSFLLIKKKSASPKVAIVFNNKDYGYSFIGDYSNAAFWNNYPYLVLTSEKKIIKSNVTVFESGNSAIPLNSFHKNIFFRVKGLSNILIVDSCLQALKKNPTVIILTDSLTIKSVRLKMEKLQMKNKVLILNSETFLLPCELSEFSYFFIIDSNNKTKNIYFPTEIVPDMTKKYLEHNTENMALFN